MDTSRLRRPDGSPPFIFGHRGVRGEAPENTMSAFELAADSGADGIELDVRFDGDRNVVVFHDSPLERLTGQPGRMEDLSASARAALRVGGEPVPLLAEVLAAFDLEVDVEIKSRTIGRSGALVAATARVIRDSGRADKILV